MLATWAIAVVTQPLMDSGKSLMPLDDYDDRLSDNEVSLAWYFDWGSI